MSLKPKHHKVMMHLMCVVVLVFTLIAALIMADGADLISLPFAFPTWLNLTFIQPDA